jgi:AcrR family transcriptional regulator
MFKSPETTVRGKQSQAAILANALRLFRTKGFDDTKMREIATDADAALGAAYYYFPSKEAIVQAYYETVQSEHEQRVRSALSVPRTKLRDRLGLVFHSKLDILRDDRKLLGTIFRYTGEPDHPLSVLGPTTRGSRAQSIATFALALGDENLPKDIREFLPIALWALHMGILIFFIYDNSPEQQRTRKLTDGALDLVVGMLSIFKSPLLKPVRGKLLTLLHDVDLLPHPQENLKEEPL